MRAGPVFAALGGLLVVAAAGYIHEPPDDARHRHELSSRLDTVRTQVDANEKAAQNLRPSARPRSALPAAVPVVEAVHATSYQEPEAIVAPEGVKLEGQLSSTPYSIGRTYVITYKVTNTRATAVLLDLYFEYCTADDFVVEKHKDGVKLEAGAQRMAKDELTYSQAAVSKIEIQAKEYQ